MRKVKALITALLVVVLLTIPSIAMASYAYDYGNTIMTYGDDCVYEADRCWGTLGFTYSSYLGSNFTKSTFLNNCASGNGAYAYTHGSKSTRAITDNAGNYIYPSEVSSYRGTDWKKLVFMDACYTSDDDKMAKAWGISNGDGSTHAYIGWVNESADSWAYYTFTTEFFYWVKNKKTIKYALDQAKAKSGVTNYYAYGDVYWSY